MGSDEGTSPLPLGDGHQQQGTGNPILDGVSQPIDPSAGTQPAPDPQGGGVDGLLNDLTSPQQPAPGSTPELPSVDGETDKQIEQDLDSANFDARLAQGKLFGGSIDYGSPSGGGGGGGYKFDPQHLESILHELKQHRMDCMEDWLDIKAVEDCSAPAPDVDSSEMQAKAVREWGDRLRRDNQAMIDTLNQRIQEFEDAKRQYMEQERITEEQWNKLAKSMQA